MSRNHARTGRVARWVAIGVALATLSAMAVTAPVSCLPALWRPASLRCVAADSSTAGASRPACEIRFAAT